jgi:hypothetical protein
LRWSRAHQAALAGGRKTQNESQHLETLGGKNLRLLRLLEVIREKLLFCSTSHWLRNKISLPALPDFNAGKLFAGKLLF